MFSKNTQKTFIDLSAELNDELDWEVGDLRLFEYHLNVTALAYEPVSGFLAVGELCKSVSLSMSGYKCGWFQEPRKE